MAILTTTRRVPEVPNFFIAESNKEIHSLLLNLPKDLIHAILLHLGEKNIKNISPCNLVSKQLYQVTQHKDLWKELYQRCFQLHYPMQDFSLGFHNACKISCRLQSNLINGIYRSLDFNEHDDFVCSLLIFDGKLISCSSDATIKIWNMETGECLNTLEGHTDQITAITVVSGMLFSFSSDQTIKAWDIDTGGCLNTFTNDVAFGDTLVFSEGKAFSVSNAVIYCADFETREAFTVFCGHEKAISSVATCDGKLFSGSTDGVIKIWDIKTKKCLRTLDANGRSKLIRSLVAYDGKLFSGSVDGVIKVWDINTGYCLNVFQAHKGPAQSLVVFKGRLISCSDDNHVKIWEIETGKCLKTLESRRGEVTNLQVIDEKLFLCTQVGLIQLWDFTRQDSEIFAEIRDLFGIAHEHTDAYLEAFDRFFRMPKKQQNQVFDGLELNAATAAKSGMKHLWYSMVHYNWLSSNDYRWLSVSVNEWAKGIDRYIHLDEWAHPTGPLKKQKKNTPLS